MLAGLIDLPWWGYVLVTLALTHITIGSVTIYLHRHQAHRALDLHPVASHFFRFWLWLTTGMITKEWAAIHRKHHAKCETAEDPHSPQVLGIKKVFFEGAELYRAARKERATMEKYGSGKSVSKSGNPTKKGFPSIPRHGELSGIELYHPHRCRCQRGSNAVNQDWTTDQRIVHKDRSLHSRMEGVSGVKSQFY